MNASRKGPVGLLGNLKFRSRYPKRSRRGLPLLMTDNSLSQHDAEQLGRRSQFSLRAVLLFVFVASIICLLASKFPRQSAFAFSMALLLLFPLVVVGVLREPFVRLGTISNYACPTEGRMASSLRRPLRFLGLWQPSHAPSLVASLTTGLISTIVLVGLWPLIREIGLNLALGTLQPIEKYTYTFNDAARSMRDAFSETEYWTWVWQWELWSLGRWWLLFGALVLFWLAASLLLKRWFEFECVTSTIGRFLAFAPWFIVLEVTFLIGVWIESPGTVAEPSTGFVVGIFAWELWHWDCWLDRGWIIRGALPTFIAGVVFFPSVLRWWWVPSAIAAIILVPIALLLSVACTVAYQNGLSLSP